MKCQLLIKKLESVDIKHLNNSKACIEYKKDMDDIYKNFEEYNPDKKHKILIVFYDMIDHMLNNKKCNPIVTNLFSTGRKLNISTVFVTEIYWPLPKNARLRCCTHFFITKVPNKQELQQIAFYHLSDTDFKDYKLLQNMY